MEEMFSQPSINLMRNQVDDSSTQQDGEADQSSAANLEGN